MKIYSIILSYRNKILEELKQCEKFFIATVVILYNLHELTHIIIWCTYVNNNPIIFFYLRGNDIKKVQVCPVVKQLLTKNDEK